MVQCLICALKAKYSSLAVGKLILALEKKKRIPTIFILFAMIVLGKAWNTATNKTFTNYFKKAGFSEKEMERAEEYDPFTSLDDIEEDSVQTLGADLAFLKEKCGNQVDYNISLDEYVDFEIEVNTTHGKLTNQEKNKKTNFYL